MDKRDVTVLLLTQGRASSLPLALAHLESQGYPSARFEIIIIDQGRADDTLAMLERYVEGAPVRTRWFRQEDACLSATLNLAARQAEGRWLLFLDGDLLAGPQLVARHVESQEQQGGSAAQFGSIEVHPQAEATPLTEWMAESKGTDPRRVAPPTLLEWGAQNLCLARAAVLDTGFDESPSSSGAEMMTLGWRLTRGGTRAVRVPEATAYVWQPMGFDRERERHYAMGYALHSLEKETPPEQLRLRYGLNLTAVGVAVGRFNAPFCESLSRLLSSKSRPFDYICRQVLNYEMSRGYTDAAACKPPRTTNQMLG